MEQGVEILENWSRKFGIGITVLPITSCSLFSLLLISSSSLSLVATGVTLRQGYSSFFFLLPSSLPLFLPPLSFFFLPLSLIPPSCPLGFVYLNGGGEERSGKGVEWRGEIFLLNSLTIDLMRESGEK